MSVLWDEDGGAAGLLLQAALSGDLVALAAVLADGAGRVDAQDSMGRTALRLAATAGHVEACKMLLDHGASIDLEDRKAQTPLAMAVKHHQLACAKLLLERGAAADGSPRSLEQPISWAVFDGYAEAVQLLLSHGAACEPPPGRAVLSTPLYAALAYRQRTCFTHLLRGGADPDHYCRQHGGGSGGQGRKREKACLSLYFAVIHHNTCEVEYAALLYNFGASLYHRDNDGRLPRDIDCSSDATKFIATLYNQPMPLTSRCRLLIRAAAGRRRLSKLSSLPLPQRLIDFLHHEEGVVTEGHAGGRFYHGWEARQVGPPPRQPEIHVASQSAAGS